MSSSKGAPIMNPNPIVHNHTHTHINSNINNGNSSTNGNGVGFGGTIFPDLHHRMSKKIAQLTKVIYHLNTINEDHQSEMNALISSHESEMQELIRDATHRFKSLQSKIDTKQSIVHLESQLATLQHKYTLEKESAMQELFSYQSQYQSREAKLTIAFKQRVDEYAKEVEILSKEYHSHQEIWEKKVADYDIKLMSAKQLKDHEIQQLEIKYDQEMSELIRINNEKYQSMLIEQLQAQQQLRHDHEVAMKQYKQSIEQQYQVEVQQKIELTTKQLQQQHSLDIKTLTSEFDQKLNEQRAKNMQDMERLLLGLQHKQQEIDDATAQLNQIKEVTSSEITRCNALLSSSMISVEAITKERDELTKECDSLRSLQMQSQGDIDRLQGMLISQMERYTTLENSVTLRQDEIEQLNGNLLLKQNELEELKLKLQVSDSESSAVVSLKQRLAISERDADSLRAEVNSMGASLAAAREDLKLAQKQAGKSTHDLEKLIAAISMDKETLNTKLKETIASSAAASEKLSNEVQSLRNKLTSELTRCEQDRAHVELKHNQRVKVLEDQLAAAIADRFAIVESLEERVKTTESMLEMETSRLNAERTKLLDELTATHQQQLTALRDEHQKELAIQIKKYEVDTEQLQSAVSGLEQQVQAIAEGAEATKRMMKNEITSLEMKLTLVTRELEQKKFEFDRAESIQSSLKSQVESLREECQAIQKTFKAKHEAMLAETNAEWERKLAELLANSSSESTQALHDLTEKHRVQLLNLATSHVEELSQQKEMHWIRIAELEVERDGFKAEIERLRNVNERDQLEYSMTFSRCQSEFESRIEALGNEHKEYLHHLTEAHAATMRQATEDWHTKEASLTATHEKSMVDAMDAMRRDSEAALLSAQATATENLTAQEARLLRRFEQELKDTNYLHMTEREKLQQDFETALNQKESELSSLQNTLALLNLSLQGAQIQNMNDKQAFSIERDQLFGEIARIQSEHSLAMAEAAKMHESELHAMSGNATSHLRSLQLSHDNEVLSLESRNRSLHGEYSELLQLYQSRPSRDDDIQKLREYAELCRKLNGTIEQLQNEISSLKLEMLNREESYNIKFGNRPNVGVIQVIKPKEDRPPVPVAPVTGVPSSTGVSPRGGLIAPVASNKPSFYIQRGGGQGLDMLNVGVGSTAINEVEVRADKRKSSTSARSSSK